MTTRDMMERRRRQDAFAKVAGRIVERAGKAANAKQRRRDGEPGDPVHRHSLDINDPALSDYWRRQAVSRQEWVRLRRHRLDAADRYDLVHKKKGDRQGPLGEVARLVLKEFYWMIDWKTGRLDPSIATIAEKVRRSPRAVVAALKRLFAHGFLDWERRSVKTDNEGEKGPQREQATNAYLLRAPRAMSRYLAERLQAVRRSDEARGIPPPEGVPRTTRLSRRGRAEIAEAPALADGPLKEALLRLGAALA